MTNLTTPKAILIGLSLIAAAIATTPFSSSLVEPANAQVGRNSRDGIPQVQICGWNSTDETAEYVKEPKTWHCALVNHDSLMVLRR